MSGPHDSLVKETFSDVRYAAVELRAVLPAKLVKRIDFDTLELCPGSFVDKALRQLHTDLLYRVQLAGRDTYVYVVFEHQSSVDEFMPLRFLRAVLRILDKLLRDKAQLPLPVVLPILLHHSETGWKAATSMHELFDPELMALDGVSELVPKFRFLLDDISNKSDDELRNRAANQAEQLVPIVLWALRDARNGPRLMASLAAWAGALTHVFRAPDGPAALAAVFSYISKVTDSLSADDIQNAAVQAAPQVQEILMTLAEQWLAQGKAEGRAEGKAEGKAEGRAEGKAEGRAEGKAEGKAELLRKLLVLKFGELPSDAQTRLQHASEDDLTLWAERVLTATSLEQVFS